ncbi:hypothetical protein DEU36_2202 [Microbacterium sp. AG238]|nr:hypothetical protein DEU36_2202 [Microbacterium sp. AG238]
MNPDQESLVDDSTSATRVTMTQDSDSLSSSDQKLGVSNTASPRKGSNDRPSRFRS